MRKFSCLLSTAIVALACCAGCAQQAATETSPVTNKPVGQAVVKPTQPAAAATPIDGKWGTLKGRFVVKDKLPVPAKIDVNKDSEICGKVPLYDESVVVDRDGGLANVMIYIAHTPAEIHPDYQKNAKASFTVTIQGCRYAPHVSGMMVGQKLIIKNLDAVGHNSNVALTAMPSPLIPPSDVQEFELSEPESAPVSITCNIHPWMKAQLLVRPDPYFAISAGDGTFKIENLPVGRYEFVVRGEKYISKVKLGGEDVVWTRGRMTAEIKPGSNDLGEIVVDAANL